ncbi:MULTISPECIES: HEPN domain-containing protein [unclassified Phaeobacter]|uniref:ApeA N-terminal domain 1-containing protein n=1 Tax=unclassified Phaeobacter TaxID=2621772 RepID=UPI003A89B73E
MIENFEEWFAVRDGHDDDSIWPGRLSFSKKNGVILEVIAFPDGGDLYQAPSCDTGTITGYLDYQRPTTIVNPWVQSQAGARWGVDTPVMRAKARIVGSAILKNIHLTDINEACFTGISMELPSFSSWYAPKMVNTDFSLRDTKGPPAIEVGVDKPERCEFILSDQTNVQVDSYARTSDEGAVTSVTQRTSLWLQFSEAANYEAVLKRISRINTLFCFLLGHRMAQSPYRLHTTHTRTWNDESRSIVAELFIRPAFKSKTEHVEWHDALFTRHNCTLDACSILNAAVEQPDALFYLMNMVLLMEHSKKLSANTFSEFIGCLEDFDQSVFGNGSSSDLRALRKSLKAVVAEHGTEVDKQALSDLIHRSPNRYSLAQRLGRLQQAWSESGFRGSPEPKELVKLRNDISHGRAATLEDDDYQKVLWFGYYLCALSRFHIFRQLGLSAEDIGKAFCRVPHRYGMYAPRSGADGSQEARSETV